MVSDHHSEYLSKALAGLTPEGHRRVDELLDQLAESVGARQWLSRFAGVRKAEADLGRTGAADGPEPGDMLSKAELDALMTGFTVIRDQERLDDVADWANAVIMLLEDEAARYGEI